MPADQSGGPSDPEGHRSLYNRLTAFETILILGGVVLFLFLLVEMRSFLNPPLIGGTAVILLWPLRQHRVVRALLISGGFLLGLWLLDHLSSVLLPFAAVYLLAFLFNPLVSRLKQRYNVPRWISALSVTLLSLGMITLAALILVPNIVDQLQTLSSRLLSSIGFFREWLATTTLIDTLDQYNLIEREQLTQQLSNIAQSQVNAFTEGLPNTVQRILQSLGSVLGTLTTLSMTPVILFYTLKDYPVIERRLVELFPTFGGRRDYLIKAGGIVGSYLRGLCIVMAIAAFNVSFFFIILGVPFGLLLGLLAGLLNIIPNLGALITFILAALVAVIFGDPWYLDLLTVAIVLLGQGFLEQSVLTPNIMSYQVGLHPVLILLALFVFGYFMGIFGLLIAVPATALIVMVYQAYRNEWSMDLSHYTTTPEPHKMRRWPLQETEADDASDESSR